ncbi:nitrite reductase small subunit NirD [Pseudomonas sp. v388]|uniref:nitrite reductase small subunit NirD n=1 Tax=Pseudomonas sp. v388 TaxID=2479849 RepID=UPI000F7928CA|nr:nitrite reductase small subunit NirD [Pseudomonas sp. v388]RRV04544.1 nitrite reductase small subunit NirD [Pseudomonas sp. v388]
MSSSNTAFAETLPQAHAPVRWLELCSRGDLVANSGVVAWLDGRQIALFWLPENPEGQQLFAVDNRDPKSGVNVIGRGLIGQVGGELVIASPLYKQHFRLQDGSCIEYPDQRLDTWQVRLEGDSVAVAV